LSKYNVGSGGLVGMNYCSTAVHYTNIGPARCSMHTFHYVTLFALRSALAVRQTFDVEHAVGLTDLTKKIL